MSTQNVPNESGSHDATKEQLVADFKAVVCDAEALLKATAGQGGEALASLRAKTEESLAKAKADMANIEAALVDQAKAAAKATDVYVHDNPWKSIGISGGLGLLIGFLMGRR